MKINISQGNVLDDFTNLLCPNCGEKPIHQRNIEVFTGGENSKHILIKESGWVDTDKDNSKSPEKISYSILRNFDCECCTEKSVLAIYYYKGETRIKFGIIKESIIYDSK